MAQNVDDKLGLSLDDLIEKQRVKETRQQGGGRQRGGGSGGGRGGHHRAPQQRAQPYPQQRQHQRGGGGGGGSGPLNGRRGGGRHGGGPGAGGGGGGWQGPPGGGMMQQTQQQQQQQWGGPNGGGGGGAGPQRRTSVFQRLGGVPVKDLYPQEQAGGAPYLAGGPARAPRPPQQQQGGWGGPPPPRQQQGGWGGPSPQPLRRQQQQQQPAAFAPPSRELSGRIDEMGDVLVAFHGQDIVKVCANGDVYLSHAGEQSDVVLAALNEVLAYIGLKIVALGAAWSVSDGRSSQRFDDKMLVRSKGPATAGRIVAVKEAFGLEAPDAAAASAASTAAARAAGILPDAGDAAALRRLRAQGRA